MKKFAIVFLSLCLVVSLPFAAHANIVTSTGRYLINAIKHAPGGAKVTATNSVTGAKHVINHGVSSADLGKGIGAGVVTFAIGSGVGFAFQAITGLALDAVDWVMDKENNRVKWKEKGEGGGAGGATSSPYVYSYLGIQYFTAQDFCRGWAPSNGHNPNTIRSKVVGVEWICISEAGTNVAYAGPQSNPAYDPNAPTTEEKYLSLDTLAQKILDLADSGNAAAQIDIEIYVTHIAQNGDLDIELDNSSDITPSEEPENPEEPKECPSGSVKVDDVCVKIPDSDDDKPLFCDSSEFTKKVCDWIDWTQVKHDQPEPDAGKVDIKDKSDDLSIDNDRIDFSNQCPAPTPINTSVGGFPVSTELNYQPLCDFFTMLNPFVVGMGGISSALIIAGGARRG